MEIWSVGRVGKKRNKGRWTCLKEKEIINDSEHYEFKNTQKNLCLNCHQAERAYFGAPREGKAKKQAMPEIDLKETEREEVSALGKRIEVNQADLEK